MVPHGCALGRENVNSEREFLCSRPAVIVMHDCCCLCAHFLYACTCMCGFCVNLHAVKSHDTRRTSASVGLSSAAWPEEFSWFIYTICLISDARAQNLFIYTVAVSSQRFKMVVLSAHGSRMLLAFHAFMFSSLRLSLHASCPSPCTCQFRAQLRA